MLENKLYNSTAKLRTIIATRCVQLYFIVESAARQSISSAMRNILMSFILGCSGTIGVTCCPSVYYIERLYEQDI